MKKVNKNSLHEERGMYRYLASSVYKKPVPRPTQPTPANKDEGGVSILSIIKFIFMMFIAWTTLTFLNLGFKEIRPVNEINGKIFGSNSWLVNKGRSQIIINPSDSKSQATSANNYENQTVATHSVLNEGNDNRSKELKNQNGNTCSECKGYGKIIGCPDGNCNKGKVNCRSCEGMGRYIRGNGKTCLYCEGSGITICSECGGNYSTIENICYTCNGTGKTRFETTLCSSCKGDGKERCDKLRCVKGILTCREPERHSDNSCSSCNQDAGQPHGALCTYGQSACTTCDGSGSIQVEKRI